MILRLTEKTIQRDIAGFKRRKDVAQMKLAELPGPDAAYGWKQNKALDKKRLALIAEVIQAEKLIRIAREALTC